MYNNPGLAGALLTSNATSLTKTTVLVPDNSAFDKLEEALGAPIGSLTVEQLEPVLQYHLLVDELTTENFTVANGTTRPTFLTGPTYNNRSAGAALGSNGAESDPHNGQVVFMQASEPEEEASVAGAKRFRLRQTNAQSDRIEVQGGLGHVINMTAIDGYWDGGRFQIVDKFLQLPLNCTDTIRRWKMLAFRQSLDRTGLGAPLDVEQNVTCLTPNDAAFLAAGSPNSTASIFDLTSLLQFHIINEPLYSNFLQDGQRYRSVNNQTIQITERNGEIFVNDARIISSNVMTNNGVMHVLDRVMSPLDEEVQSTSSSSSGTATPTTSPTRSDTPTTSSSSTATSSAPAASETGGSIGLENPFSRLGVLGYAFPVVWALLQ
ncbi:hypothetical protein B0A52_00531 [Exophiala mesophila]|uniref:FAS1 domain-containing protein n=1 Tax=Exophiala mesophila TaxID=212818 RepID=A0A438NHH6_EXOME|nr:hypothetical protein B0A52_00531 [Exophiala mesophila]